MVVVLSFHTATNHNDNYKVELDRVETEFYTSMTNNTTQLISVLKRLREHERLYPH